MTVEAMKKHLKNKSNLKIMTDTECSRIMSGTY